MTAASQFLRRHLLNLVSGFRNAHDPSMTPVLAILTSEQEFDLAWGEVLVSVPGFEERLDITTANFLSRYGSQLRLLSRYQDAVAHHTQALTIYRDIGNQLGEAIALNNLGDCDRVLGRYQDAVAHHTQALTIYRDIGNQLGEAIALNNLGDCDRVLGRYQDAVAHHTQALTIYRHIGNQHGEARALNNLGDCDQRRGDTTAALSKWRQAEAIYVAIGMAQQAFQLRTKILANTASD